MRVLKQLMAFPSLARVCRLELRGLLAEDDLPATVAALSRLRPSVQLSLGFCRSQDGSLTSQPRPDYTDFDNENVAAPPLASIRGLTELRLEGRVQPPPDLDGLAGLRALRLNFYQWLDVEDIEFSIPGLTRLESTARPAVGAVVWQCHLAMAVRGHCSHLKSPQLDALCHLAMCLQSRSWQRSGCPTCVSCMSRVLAGQAYCDLHIHGASSCSSSCQTWFWRSCACGMSAKSGMMMSRPIALNRL